MDHPIQSGSQSSPKGQLTEMDWESVRPIVEELYYTKRRPLHEVTAQLRNRGFHATDRMFRTRIKKWRLGKNRKEAEMMAIARKLKERQAQGLRSIFMIRGRRVIPEEVHGYLSRKGMTLRDVAPADDGAIWASNEISCSTPVDSSSSSSAVGVLPVVGQLVLDDEIPVTVRASQLDKSSHFFLHSIQAYYSTMLQPNNWSLEDVSQKYPPLKFGGDFRKFHDLAAVGKQDEAYLVLGTAFGEVSALLKTGHPRLLTYFLESIAFSRYAGHEDVARQLVEFFKLTAIRVLGSWHPITIFATSLRRADSDGLTGFIEVGLECMRDQFIKHLGEAHAETMSLLLTSAAILKHEKSYHQASSRLDTLLRLYEEAFGPQSYQACHALADHSAVKTDMGDLVGAGLLIQDAMKRGTYIKDDRERVESMIRCSMNLSMLRKAERDIPQMVSILETALSLGIQEGNLGDDHWMMMHVRSMLASAPPVSSSPGSASWSMITPTSSSSVSIMTPASE